ncbi:apolipoprotein N-acyltransferase [Elusimicrobiota bacterium]
MLSLLSGLLYPLIFPKFSLYLLFPVAMIPLIYWNTGNKSGEINLKTSFIMSWVSGTLAHLIMMYWIYITLIKNNAGYFGSLLGLVSLCIYMGVYWGIFGAAVYALNKTDIGLKSVIIPCIWTLLEYSRTYILTGFPWLLAGNSLWKLTPLIQISAITGIYGLSFLVIYVNTAMVYAIKLKKLKILIPAAVMISSVFIYGIIAEKRHIYDVDKKISILQGNISQYKKWDYRYSSEILDTYRELYHEAAEYGPGLIVWPETALPDPLASADNMGEYMKELTDHYKTSQLIGSVEEKRAKYYNSAYVVSPDGDISAPYRKYHLTPFGEYIPFRKLLSPVIGVINEVGDFDAGGKIEILEAGEYRIGTGICFEGLFPGLVRSFFKKGANIFVNITNDGWYLNTAGPYQHFIHSIFRAVENRTYVIRAANTGISAVISPAGKVVKKTSLLKTEVLNSKVSISQKKTFYTKYGNIFVGICFLFVVYALWRDRRCLKNVEMN